MTWRRSHRRKTGSPRLRVAFFPMLPLVNAATRTFCERPLPFLARDGIEGKLFLPSSDRLHALFNRPAGKLRRPIAALYWYGIVAPRRIAQLVRALGCDVIFVQRSMFRYSSPPLLEVLASALAGVLLGRRIVYHLDDALYTSVSPWRFRARFRLADWVLTGNQEIASYARRVNPNVVLFPGSLDVSRYPPRELRHGGPLVWGGGVHFPHPHCARAGRGLARVCRARDVSVKVVSNEAFEAPELGSRLLWERWAPRREFSLFGDFDIGIMPLADTPYNRGKEAFKLKEYMAAGLPVVCSPVGHNCEVVENGVTGLFATTENEWVDALLRLVDDSGLRASMGAEGRRVVAERYSLPEQSERLARFFWAISNGSDEQIGDRALLGEEPLAGTRGASQNAGGGTAPCAG